MMNASPAPQEIFLLKLGEVVLKGQNRQSFEDKLLANVRRRVKNCGSFQCSLRQSTIYVEPQGEDCDMEAAWDACRQVFGIAAVARAVPCEKTVDAIVEAARTYLADAFAVAKSFKVESKRADKMFPMNSIQLSQAVGGDLAELFPHVAVDVHTPDLTVFVEIREKYAYVHTPSVPGAGGLPIGMGGRAVSLLSGGIDSPVSSWMMARRGVELEMVHFVSPPYTSQQALDKVLELARLLTVYCGRMIVHIIPFTEIQEEIRRRRRAPHQVAILELLCTIGRASAGEVCQFTGAPRSSMKALVQQGVVHIDAEPYFRRPVHYTGQPQPIPALTPAQEQVFDGLKELLRAPDAQAALLFGVTGSGKTLVYLHLIAQALAAGQGAILLVPEISLTPQMIEAFSAYFGDTVAVLHSGLPLSERYDEWKRIRAGLARVVVGTRSAVFAPVQDLGLLIIDEEQEDTYKSESTPRYHARDVAKFRCAQHRALLLLGSATPDVVSRYYAETGRYHYFTLPDRFNARKLPDVIIADMKQELRNGNSGSISSVLYGELEENLRRGEQSILFLNRRGASKIVTCAECGATYSCPNCSVSLTYHQGNQMLICHHCGYRRRVDPQCPVCGGELRFLGDGTERIEADLHALFPGVETLRMDADAIAMAGTHEALLQRFARERIPIMIGTQMITKGLNFENVTLVGVLNADQSLYVGDYRANERTFSLITQVIGRSGRGDAPGRAVIQTFTPANETIRQAARQDYDAFYRSEIRLRKLNGTPPFSEVLAVTVSGAQENAVVRCCAYIRDYFRQTIGERAEVLGPAPLPVVRMNNRYRYRVTLYCNQSKAVRRAAANIVMYCNTEKSFRDVTVFADDNPLD